MLIDCVSIIPPTLSISLLEPYRSQKHKSLMHCGRCRLWLIKSSIKFHSYTIQHTHTLWFSVVWCTWSCLMEVPSPPHFMRKWKLHPPVSQQKPISMPNYSLCQMKDATINVYEWLVAAVWVIVSRCIERLVCLRARNGQAPSWGYHVVMFFFCFFLITLNYLIMVWLIKKNN